ncbi:SseB family protein [Thiohalobacter sp. IOR34]|uniref:SseB family protein n=1 Tax=Thiohalobacter sp. IOR34 TaxID=3057176 RepID=UPI0025B216FB|nr:SseB family protein [Thiohalobacter sp. IOR34]WJW75412.1 SseB family protein [Thiohalobacter sp. IOR34]
MNEQSDVFEPRNDIERQLLAAQAGERSAEAFMEDLLAAQLFMPVEEDSTGIKGLQKSTQARPLTLESEDGLQVLILFTSPERAKRFVAEVPGDYGGGLLADFSWILQRVGSGVAIAINPGWSAGIDLDPETVQQLRARVDAEVDE